MVSIAWNILTLEEDVSHIGAIAWIKLQSIHEMKDELLIIVLKVMCTTPC